MVQTGSECCGQDHNGILQHPAQTQEARAIKAEQMHEISIELEETLLDKTRCIVVSTGEQKLQGAVGLTLSSKPFSFTICCA